MRVGQFWMALRLPFASHVLEVPHLLLFLGVHGDDRLFPLLKILALLAQVLELRIPVGMLLGPFFRLLLRLQAVFQGLAQNLTDCRRADLPSLLLQVSAYLVQTFRCPLQGPHRIAPRRRIHDFLNRLHQTRFLFGFRFPSPSRPSLPPGRWRDSHGTLSFQLSAPRDHDLLTDHQRFSHSPNPAPSKRDRFAAGPQPSGAFVQVSLQPFVFLPYHALHFCSYCAVQPPLFSAPLPIRSLHPLGHLPRQFPSIYRPARGHLSSTFYSLNFVFLGLLSARLFDRFKPFRRNCVCSWRGFAQRMLTRNWL